MSYLAIFFGGGLGAIARFTISLFVSRRVSEAFPWATLSVNFIGALFIGVIVELLALKYSASENLRYFLVTGFLGGFTTFSTFSLESALLWTRGDYWLLTGYIFASVFGTIIAVLGSMHFVRIFL